MRIGVGSLELLKVVVAFDRVCCCGDGFCHVIPLKLEGVDKAAVDLAGGLEW